MKSLPQFLKKYFWDVNFNSLKLNKHQVFIIARLLEYGNRQAVKWMENNFKPKEIKKVVCNSKNISQKSANFWQLIFSIRRNKILCLKKSFQKTQRMLWQY